MYRSELLRRRKDARIRRPADAVRLCAIAQGEAGAGQLNEVLNAPMDLGARSVKTCRVFNDLQFLDPPISSYAASRNGRSLTSNSKR